MPHSSGGGSHGGGSHGGSHSHGGSGSGGVNRRHSSTYFRGARHYVYYKNRKPIHYYSEIEITEEYVRKRKQRWKTVRIGVLCLLVFIFIVSFFSNVYTVPHKLSKTCIDDNAIIDNTDIISSDQEKAIMKQLDEFNDLTGISVTILTVNDEEWNRHYASLERYAYDYYVTTLRDEKNWLIVYSEPSYYEDFNNWKWEGMQGDDTDPILTMSSTSRFNSIMHKNISKDGFAEAVSETFDSYNDIVMKPSFSILNLMLSLMGIGMIGAYTYFISWAIFGAGIKIDESSIELANPTYTYIEDTCKFCNGLYIHGIHLSCPHCGGTLDPLDRPIIVHNENTDW